MTAVQNYCSYVGYNLRGYPKYSCGSDQIDPEVFVFQAASFSQTTCAPGPLFCGIYRMQNFARDDMSEFLVRFVPQHATFRLPELESCALLCGMHVETPLTFVEYDDSLPFAIIKLENEKTAAALIRRSILVQ